MAALRTHGTAKSRQEPPRAAKADGQSDIIKNRIIKHKIIKQTHNHKDNTWTQ
ncbi:hypothetical protein CLOBOL_06047 [Enterocloster bolteae ATCC BAA-613]|uniref:Uncharacterized protein n=1 Tax=Enterocloster bolteae (strain ATCC BAA-613 / DSM 15670 / CCUG 46953 / JCM 12243 / WAL 16351) TaxID=411902 RepID=A8S2D9_ENTBW|nr:hypothetical protein CLOBOL_06047 [Enterocloster bolteae ATCC BAA-613]